MKKNGLALLLVFASSLALAQIPNNGFESWSSMGAYENPDQWGTLNNATSLLGVYTATKGTPGSPGSSYLKLTSKTFGSSVANGVAVSGVLDSTTLLPISGFPFTQRPANFIGKWQHMIFGSSQGSVQVMLTRWDTGLNTRVSVASANYALTGMAMSWANFTIPLTYTDGNAPDTCIIVLKASGSLPTNNDYLWVDNLSFSGLVTGISETSFLNAVSIYPNPSTEKLSLDLNLQYAQRVSVEMYDLKGKLVLSENTKLSQGNSVHVLNVSMLDKGTYLLRIACAEGTKNEKIIIQ